MRFFLILFLAAFFLTNCSQNEASSVCTTCDQESMQKDSVERVTGDNLLETKDKPTKQVTEKIENHQRIVQKYGEQWDFCICAKVNDSINRVSQLAQSEKQLEKLMKRWNYVDIKCKEFITNPNRTPEERELHEKKVAKCLEEK